MGDGNGNGNGNGGGKMDTAKKFFKWVGIVIVILIVVSLLVAGAYYIPEVKGYLVDDCESKVSCLYDRTKENIVLKDDPEKACYVDQDSCRAIANYVDPSNYHMADNTQYRLGHAWPDCEVEQICKRATQTCFEDVSTCDAFDPASVV
jgi:hypothetical protein